MSEYFEILLGLFASAFISATIAPGGSEALLVYILSDKTIDTWLLIAVATVGNTFGAISTALLGLLFSIKFPVEQTLSHGKRKAIASVRKWGLWSLLFSWLPVVGDGFCFAAGWLRLPVLPALLAIFLGKFARYTAVTVATLYFIQ